MTIYALNKITELSEKLYSKIIKDFPLREESSRLASICVIDNFYFKQSNDLCFSYFPCVYQIINETKGLREGGYEIFQELKAQEFKV
ncbi:hypothetical protein HOE22_10760 [Candidatus Woesearchaeota archaeon]|nr:hypothetical protein [Candidatus Woesearchaeota archaeon]MBT4208801.1 hypothetical protein [Candidatus Woesearchaeota archaeon]MBT5111651.1 hypothetical protein [Candidatus Woesearchaeota archaeon]MBT6760792.1 hypothetical protein [Candidatus Woesearchaeota archaeon]MBT7149232.1 hypothetical protein [Candidatus Woesearchaeota archaeon]